ncbi:MAG: hypothetical protein ABIG03_07535 [Candidatus Eisenbacteria bacterium]
MSEPRKRVGCVIVAHGTVAECLMDGIQGILGKQTGWVTVSNRGLSLKDLNDEVARAVQRLKKDHEVIIFSDMPGGSCHHACQEFLRHESEVRVVSGLNLMMLLEFFVKREHKPLDQLLNLIIDRGRDSVRLI